MRRSKGFRSTGQTKRAARHHRDPGYGRLASEGRRFESFPALPGSASYHDAIVWSQNAEINIVVRQQHKSTPPYVYIHGDLLVLFDPLRCQPLKGGIVGFFAPSRRKTRIDVSHDMSAIVREHDFGSCWLPFRPEPGIDEPPAMKCATLLRPTVINLAAALARDTVRAPVPPRLIQLNDSQELAAKRTRAAASTGYGDDRHHARKSRLPENKTDQGEVRLPATPYATTELLCRSTFKMRGMT